MVVAALSVLLLWSMLFGVVAPPLLAVLCAAVGGFLLLFGHHEHRQPLIIDVLSHSSRFSGVNAALKLSVSLALLLLCLLSRSPLPPLALFLILSVVTVGIGGLSLHRYCTLLALPVAFLLLSCLALLWGFSPTPQGVLQLPLPGGWLVVHAAARQTVQLLLARALGSVACLYFLSLSTPMPELLAVLRSCRVPAVMTELAVLIYRYIFILTDTCHNMKTAAQSRLGFRGLSSSLKTTGKVYAQLLAGSFRRASSCFDAMESRCYTGEIRFLTQPKPIALRHLVPFALLLAAMALAVALGYR